MDDILRAHAAELHPAYRELERLEGRNREQAAALIDFLVGENLAIPPDLALLGDAIPCLRAAVDAAQPDRSCIAYIVTRFGDWLARLTATARPVFLEEFPTLAPAVRDLSDDGMQRVLDAVNRDPRALSCLGSYAMTNREIIRAMAKLAVEATLAGRVDLLQALVGAVPLEKMEASKDAERLVPAIAEVPQALAVAVAFAKHDPSSAYGACKALAKVVPKHPHAAEYLRGCEALVATIGAQCAGFATSDLPGLYAKHGPDTAARLVQAAVECAHRYGPRAAQALLERKTEAARGILP